METLKTHWEKVYTTKQPDEVSWTQAFPKTSLDLINGFGLPQDASIIDIGGGDSRLVDHLLAQGYSDVTVLDISERAVERAKQRLGDKAIGVKWIVSDIIEFRPTKAYDIWHDRATFHFLTSPKQIGAYAACAKDAVKAFITIGTFSHNGPKQCSGLDVQQYSEGELEQQLSNGFAKLKCVFEDHLTPFQTHQNFIFCSFRRTHQDPAVV